MTVAAGLPIASLIAGGQKAQSQSGAQMATAKASANHSVRSGIPSFRAGLEAALTEADQADVSGSESSEAIKGRLAEAAGAPDTQSDAKPDLLNRSSSPSQRANSP